MSARKTQVLLIAGAVVLTVLLFIAPKQAPPEEKGISMTGSSAHASASLDVFLNLALKALAPDQKILADKFKASHSNDSLVHFWGKFKRPDLAAYYAEEEAKSKGTAENWFNAGNRYYYSTQFIQDKSEMPALYQSAIRCFEKGLKLEPGNTDAKIMLASCYVEGGENPMEGVNRLREIEKTDSNNVKLQLTFAFFSVKSRQLDKAIVRFKKVLQIDSNYIEAYLHLADAYEQLGETEKTINMLEKYSAKTADVTARAEINKYINQLKQSR